MLRKATIASAGSSDFLEGEQQRRYQWRKA
jgi:hypothetical protein